MEKMCCCCPSLFGKKTSTEVAEKDSIKPGTMDQISDYYSKDGNPNMFTPGSKRKSQPVEIDDKESSYRGT
jgi:hypothetical protein